MILNSGRAETMLVVLSFYLEHMITWLEFNEYVWVETINEYLSLKKKKKCHRESLVPLTIESHSVKKVLTKSPPWHWPWLPHRSFEQLVRFYGFPENSSLSATKRTFKGRKLSSEPLPITWSRSLVGIPTSPTKTQKVRVSWGRNGSLGGLFGPWLLILSALPKMLEICPDKVVKTPWSWTCQCLLKSEERKWKC